MPDLTMQEWVTTPATPFHATEEQSARLQEIIDQLREWSTENELPCVLLTGKASTPGVSYSISGYSSLEPVGRVPSELLVAHVMATIGLEQGVEVVDEIIHANGCRANVLLKVVKSDE